jgi:hypothetical protein
VGILSVCSDRPGAPLVKDDEARERRQPLPHPAEGKQLPRELDMRDECGNEHDIDGPIADYLEGDAAIAGLGVSGLGHLHPRASFHELGRANPTRVPLAELGTTAARAIR